MQEHLLNYLIASYVLLIGVSVLVSIVMYFGYPSGETREAPLYWTSVLFGFLIQGLLNFSPQAISLAMLSSVPTVMAVASMSRRLFGNGLGHREILSISACSLVAVLILQLISDEFWLYAIPISFAVGGLFITNAWLCYDSKSSMSSKMLNIVIGLSGLHILDFPFLRMNETFAIPGFIVAYINGFLMAILVPVVTVESLRRRYTEQLESDVALATADLRESNRGLDKAQKEIKELVRILCHDMANSVTVARFGIDAIEPEILPLIPQMKQSDVDMKRWLLTMRSVIENQFDLIESVRTLQSISDDKVEFALEPVHLSEVVAYTEILFEAKLKAKGLTLLTDIDPDLYFLGDRSTFANCIIGNILSNAIKFSFANQAISIKAQALSDERLQIVVSDSGQGIKKERLDAIFSSTRSTSTVGTQGEKGTGFGMPIIKMMTEKFGGTLKIESTPFQTGVKGHGTSLTITLQRSHLSEIVSPFRKAS